MEAASVFKMAAAASAAACVSDVLTFPVDTLKVRMQLKAAPGQAGARLDLLREWRALQRERGALAVFNGLRPGVQRQAVYAALRMSLYPHARDWLRERAPAAVPDLAVKTAAGMAVGAAAMGAANPFEVVKIRMQANSGKHTMLPRSTLRNFAAIARREGGVAALFRGVGPNMLRCAVICAAELVSYDEFKRAAVGRLGPGVPAYLAAGTAAGLVAAVVGSPVDVVKTTYQNAVPGEFESVTHCVRGIWRNAGLWGFYRGFTPNFLRIGGFNLLIFVFYEQFLALLTAGEGRSGVPGGETATKV